MKDLEKKMFQPDVDNPSGRYPLPRPHCQQCGVMIHGTPLRWGSDTKLCGLCFDDRQNEDKREQQKP